MRINLRIQIGAVAALLLGGSHLGISQQRTSVVVNDDPRGEVLAIMFHLAGAGEYNGGSNKLYLRRIDSAFAQFKQHPAIEEIRRLRKEYGVGFEAVMSMAVNIADPITFAERTPIDATSSSLSGRWRGATARPFLKLAEQFAKDANVAGFLQLSKPLYDSASVRMKRYADERAHLEWLAPYFTGVPGGLYFLSPLLANSGGAYATRFDNGATHERHAFIGIGENDAQGFPVVSTDFLPTVIHEFTHSYVNSVVEARSNELRASGERVFNAAKTAMSSQAYTSPGSMLNESIVRATVIRYLLANDGPDAAAAETRLQRGVGFIWMNELAPLFADYESNRTTYPTLASFMPRVIDYYNALAPRIESMTAEFNSHRPSIVTSSIANDAVVDANTSEITVRFSRAMGAGPSMNRITGTGFPEVVSYSFNADKSEFTIRMKLEPNKSYGMEYTGAIFASTDGYPLNNFSIRFRTR